MTHQWGRLIYWLSEGQNAAAVQALSAIVVAILTAALIWVTSRYVHLTKAIAETTRQQLAASVQPVLALAILESGILTRKGQAVSVSGRIGVKNRGSNPVKVVSISLIVQFKSPQKFLQIPCSITQRDNVVLMPEEEDLQLFNKMLTEMTADEAGDYVLGAGVDCTDLAGVSEHSFYVDPQGQLRHFFGFRKAPLRPALARRLMTQVVQILRKWSGWRNIIKSSTTR